MVNCFATNLKHLRKKNGMLQSDISEMLGKESTSGVSEWEKGLREPLTGDLSDLARIFNVSMDDLMKTDLRDESNLKSPSIRINVYGSIPAGIPLEAIEDIIGWEEIPYEWAKGDKEYIALKVRGDSMYPKYLEGDTVIIQLQPDCETGQDCACYVNGFDSTLKRIDKKDGSITLEPINPNYSPKTYKHPGEVQIVGRVKELRRKF